ncbi:MAG: hypothetical protein ACLT76_15740 [Clostridium fessum]
MRQNLSRHETVKTDVDSGAGAQLLLLVLALFLVVWLVPDAGKSMHPGRKLQRLRQMAAMWRRMKKMEPPGI